MKIFISADIEGISGIVNRSHLSSEGHDYERARKLMTDEVNAAISGAIKAGAEEIIVNDSHGSMTNILMEDLNPKAQLITGYPKNFSMMAGLDSTFDAVIFVGYHARMNTPGVLSHSYDGRIISDIHINDMPVGEFGLNALLAGFYDVPVVAVTGDNILGKEVQSLNDKIRFVPVKEAQSRYSAKCIHPSKVHEMIENKVREALEVKNEVKACKLEGAVELDITFMNTALAESAAIMPGSVKKSPNKVSYKAKDIEEAYRMRMVLTTLAGEVV